MRKIFTLMFALFLGAATAHAQQTVKIFETNESNSPAILEWKFTVPPFGVEHQVRLGLDARVDWKTLAGSNPWMRVAINGNFLTRPDLLNKPDEFKTNNGLDLTWSKGDRWRVIYSPDFEAAIKQKDEQYAISTTDPYRYVWDITRFVKPGENELSITNLQVLQESTKLVLRNAVIEVGKAISPPATAAVEPAPTGPIPAYMATPARKLPIEVRTGNGLLSCTVAGQSFNVATRTSLPDGKWHDAAGATGNEAALTHGGQRTVNWRTPLYSVQRKIDVRDSHVHIADTFTNTTPNLIGVIVEHRLPYVAKPDHTYVAGRETLSERVSAQNGNHPSVFAQWKTHGVGLVAEDDIFRVHIRSFTDADSMTIADNQLAIEPGKPVTLEWNIYPVLPTAGTNSSAETGGDYWDFVNAVRRDWDVNYTIPGPFIYFSYKDNAPAGYYGEWMRERDVKITCGGIAKYANGRYAHGTGIMFAPEWVQREADVVADIHKNAPGVKALCYFHAQISTEPDAEKKYADDRVFDDSGKHLSYPYSYPLPMYLPTRESAYGKALWGYVKTCLDEIKADGLYWDEMTHSIVEYTKSGPWDGHTVLINPQTHAIVGKRTSVPLVMQPLKLDIIRHLQSRNKYLMANTQPLTRTMMREKIVRFVETGTYSALTNTHLGCPLGLGNHHVEDSQAARAEHVRRMLQYGAVYYGHYYRYEPPAWNFTSVMYPITPVQLGPGFVIGQERIHTTVSGRFGFPDGAAADVYVVDAKGNRVAKPKVQEVTENSKRQYEIRIPSDHFAVLVKK